VQKGLVHRYPTIDEKLDHAYLSRLAIRFVGKSLIVNVHFDCRIKNHEVLDNMQYIFVDVRSDGEELLSSSKKVFSIQLPLCERCCFTCYDIK